MTYEEAKALQKKRYAEDDPKGDLTMHLLVRKARPGYSLTEPSWRDHFWIEGVLMSGMPPGEFESLGDADRAADDWDVVTYYP